MLFVPCAGFSGPKEWSGNKRYPAFFIEGNKKQGMFHFLKIFL